MGEKLPALLVVVLLLSCFACASCIEGTLLDSTLLQLYPGNGETVLTTLPYNCVVDVTCRTPNASVYGDPWWLLVTYAPPNDASINGWVADYYVDCGNVGNCNVVSC